MSAIQAGAEPVPTFAVLLAGGKGTRFWPASRTAHPKQFLTLVGNTSLLRLTFERFARIVPTSRILVVTASSYAERIRNELSEIPPENIIHEPSGRDTAPAACLAALSAMTRHPDPILILSPTDHVVQDEAAFAAALSVGIESARAGSLVTFGVVPDRPATSYGYIEVEKGARGEGPARVLRFREKPGEAEAAAFLATGRFYWNAGIFAWRASVFMEELASADASLAAAVSRLPAMRGQAPAEAFVRAWERLPSISLDYALLEKSSKVFVVPLLAGWNDVGSWDSIREFMPADGAGNRLAEDVLYVGARGCSVHRQEGAGSGDKGPARKRLYALLGTEGLIVVETEDAVLICRRGAGESLREVVRRLKSAGREDLI